MRQLLAQEGVKCQCVRCREVKDSNFENEETEFEIIKYDVTDGVDYFISIKTNQSDKLIGLVRLFLPNEKTKNNQFLQDLDQAAIIRELHVYGQQKTLNQKKYKLKSHSQHKGFGKQLMQQAKEIARQAMFKKIAVISAIGTRQYNQILG